VNDRIPLHRPDIGEDEIAAVSAVLRSGWLTTGNECRQFEAEFAALVGAQHAVAVSSCTAALHLALEATGCQRADCVLVPTLTFAATAEVVAYFGAIPVLVDSERETLNIDVASAQRTLAELEAGRPVGGVVAPGRVHAIMPVHYGGQMVDVDAVAALAQRHGLRVIEDAAHALPAAARSATGAWRSVGTTAEQTCFSFYANKTITTGEGGMLVTDDETLAARARRMSLHGLSNDSWNRYNAGGSWDYQIISAGFKYNLTDVAAALGRRQLRKAASLAAARGRIAARYAELLGDVAEVELPRARSDRQHAWHLYPLRLRLESLTIDRNEFVEELGRSGIGTSVHWRPLHLHPYYRERFSYQPNDFPVANREWERLISLPVFPSMSDAEVLRVAQAVRTIAGKHARPRPFK
jgi:perosamine synthetase